jgi:alkylated DNA repair dioxygenase AlkB
MRAQQPELFSSDLFSHEPAIPGFSLRLNYLSGEEENQLLAHVEGGAWETDWRRRIQQYGLGYSGTHGQSPGWLRDFPEWLLSLAGRVAHEAEFERFPENCVINEYIPPLGIGPHRDYGAFGPTIACVSLGSDIVVDFIDPSRHLRVPIQVPARSLWVITGEARSVWQHGIAARLSDTFNGQRRQRSRRISITFRTARDQRLVGQATRRVSLPEAPQFPELG